VQEVEKSLLDALPTVERKNPAAARRRDLLDQQRRRLRRRKKLQKRLADAQRWADGKTVKQRRAAADEAALPEVIA
jgi:hypothetical protein